MASHALAECPAHLFAFSEAARFSAILKEPAPEQRHFRNFGGFIDYFTTSQGDELMFGAMVRIDGRVLTLTNITILPLGASDFQTPVDLTTTGVRKARDQILAKARQAGFAVVVFEGDRVSGATKRNGGKSRPVSKIVFLEN